MNTDTSIWQGKRVRLRAIEPSDWNVYYAWNRDDEQARGVSSIPCRSGPAGSTSCSRNRQIAGVVMSRVRRSGYAPVSSPSMIS